MVFFTAPAWASTTLSFAPTKITVEAGTNYNLKLVVNPHGVKNYTAKAEVKYPADLIEVKSFTFGSGWMALAQSGYDLIDNTRGVLIKTAGYPGGVSDSTAFGTISFLAKKTGSGVISIGDKSLVLDAASQNVFVGPLAKTILAGSAAVPGKPMIPSVPSEAPKEISVPEEPAAPVEVLPVPGQQKVEKPALFDIAIEPGIQETKADRLKFVGLVVFVILLLTGAGYILYKKKKSS